MHDLQRNFPHASYSMAGYGRLIAQARDAAGLNKIQLAERLAVDPSVVSKLENEKVGITPEMFMRLTTELRGLVPAELANAIGYQVTVAGADRLPRPLVQALLRREPEDWVALTGILEREGRGHQRREQPQ